MKIPIVIIFIILLIEPIQGQLLNIDRENGQDSTFRKVAFSYNVSFTSDKQTQNLLDLSNEIELDFFLKKDKHLLQ